MTRKWVKPVGVIFALGFVLEACSSGPASNSGGTGGDASGGSSSDGGTGSGGEASGGKATGGGTSTGGAKTGGTSGTGADSGLGGLGGDGGSGSVVAGDPPSIFLISDIGTTPGTPFSTFTIHFYDDYTASEDFEFSVESSDEAFLPLSGIVLGPAKNEGSPDVGHFYRDLTLTPSTLASGSATITIKVKDGAGQPGERSFTASINSSPQNDAEAVSVSGGASPVLGNSYSLRPAISSDGNLVAFESTATNLGAGAGGGTDIYVRNRSALTTTRITGGIGQNERPTLTPDGRYVAFYSTAALVAGDTNALADCYLYDRQTTTFELVSVADDESLGNAAALPGTFVSSRPALSDDGRYVAFISAATNLVSGDTNAKVDVFVRDRTSGTTTRVSVSSTGVESDGDSDQPTMSGDGSKVAFSSVGKTLVDGVTDTDTRADVFVRSGGATTRISNANGTTTAANGASDSPAFSGDGKFLAFSSAATNLGTSDDNFGHVDIWRYDMTAGTFLRINTDLGSSGTQGYCSGPSLSSDGKKVVFTSQGYYGTYLSDKPQTFSYDVTGAILKLASLNNVASVPNGGTSYESVLSGDGTTIAFQTAATDIIFGDTNSSADVFVVPF